MSGPNFRPVVLAARERLVTGREKLKRLHKGGEAGIQVSRSLTDLVDTVVLELFEAALTDVGDDFDSIAALVAHGGYGRRDIAPFSDVDLMLLYAPDSERRVRPLAQRLMQDICDSGLQLGFSLRDPKEACTLALSDATIFTSVAESRCLAGNRDLFAGFMKRLRQTALRHSRTLIPAIERSRFEERMKYGETVFLLTPNIKRSRGGLRDIQLVRWVGFARHGETDLATLEDLGVISPDDRQQLQESQDYLLRLRNELHFHSGKSHDVLDGDEQLRMAESHGCQGDEGLMPVEQFMREYYRYTSNVRYSSAHFVATAKMRKGLRVLLNAMASHNVEGDFRVGPANIGATRRGLKKVASDVAEVLRLMDLANLYDKRIDHRTWQTIRDSMSQLPSVKITDEVRRRFLSLMSQPSRLGDLLHRLHELGVLEKIVQGMSHARCLMQFNAYHKYTVDEHSIRAVDYATRFFDDQGPTGEAYRGLKNKRLLHLAVLVHDLGKGHAEDHCELGARLAEETAQRLGLPKRETEALRFLVRRHLMLSQLSRFRDVDDPDVIVDVAVRVGSPERLQMLYVLTCADLAAVGPGVLTQWKRELLTQLYLNVRGQLTGEASVGTLQDREARRDELRSMLARHGEDAWWDNQVASLPPAYLYKVPTERLADELERMRDLSRSDAMAWGRYSQDTETVEYTIGTYEDIAPGVFHRLTGALTSQRLEILSAEIHTLADGLVLDRFCVQDRDFEGEPPEHRLADVCESLTSALKQPTDEPPRFPSIWGRQPAGPKGNLQHPPVQVRVDNSTSEGFTILDVFALDRMGLLYTITRMLFELGLSVHIAKIGAYVDQVVDVFYVTDLAGNKILDDGRLEEIRTRLLEKITEFEESGSN